MDPTPSQAHSLWLEQSTLLSRSLNLEGHSTLQNCLSGDRGDDLALPLSKTPAPPGIHLTFLLWASEARDLSAQETGTGPKWKRLPGATTVTAPGPHPRFVGEAQRGGAPPRSVRGRAGFSWSITHPQTPLTAL